MGNTLSKVVNVLIISSVINIGAIIFRELFVVESSCEEQVRKIYIAIASLILLTKLQDKLIEINQREQQERKQAEIERQLEQQILEIDFQILNVQDISNSRRCKV